MLDDENKEGPRRMAGLQSLIVIAARLLLKNRRDRQGADRPTLPRCLAERTASQRLLSLAASDWVHGMWHKAVIDSFADYRRQ